MPTQSSLQSGKQGHPLLAQGRQVATNAAEGQNSGFRAEGARNLLLHFDHPNVALGLIIVKRHGEIFQEGQHQLPTSLKSIEQVVGRMPFARPWQRRAARGWRVGLPTLFNQPIIFASQSQPGKRVQADFPALLGGLYSLCASATAAFSSKPPILAGTLRL